MLTASKRAQQAGQPHRRQSHPTVLAGVCLEGKICRQRWGWGVKVESWCRAPGVRDNSAFLSNKYFRMSPLPLNFILKDTCSYNIFCVPFNNRGVLLEPDSFQFSWPLTEGHDFLASRWRPSRARTLSPRLQAELHRNRGDGSQRIHLPPGEVAVPVESSPLSLLGAGADRAPGNLGLQGFCPVINYQRIMSLSCPWPKWHATKFTSVIESNRESNLLKPLKVSLMLGFSE